MAKRKQKVSPSVGDNDDHEHACMASIQKIGDLFEDISKASTLWKREGGRIDPVSTILAGLVLEQHTALKALEALYYDLKTDLHCIYSEVHDAREGVDNFNDDLEDVSTTLENHILSHITEDEQ